MAVTIVSGGDEHTVVRDVRADELDWAGLDLSPWPLLARCVKAGPAQSYSTKVEWLVGNAAAANYTEIVRVPFAATNPFAAGLALATLFDRTESVLWDGVPSLDMAGRAPCGRCGGVLHYLGRQPTAADTVLLKVLRHPTLIHRGADTPAEWLTEFSLLVIGAPETPRVPPRDRQLLFNGVYHRVADDLADEDAWIALMVEACMPWFRIWR